MSTKYTFKSVFEEDSGFDTTSTKEFYADTLPEILEEFREFLLGVGFSPETIEKYMLIAE